MVDSQNILDADVTSFYKQHIYVHQKIKYQDNILQSIGNTPLIRMTSLAEGLPPLMLAKMEFSIQVVAAKIE